MLIDDKDGNGDGDGEISTEEFKPVWQILIDTNLTNVKLENITEQWKNFETIIFENLEKTKSSKWIKNDKKDAKAKVQMILEGFQKGNWNNQLYFRLLNAGKTFRNIIWGKKQIGSIVSTQGDIITLYINEKSIFGKDEKDFVNIFKEHLKEKTQIFIEKTQGSHYGVGEIQVNLFAISKLDSQNKVTEILNDILDVIRKFV